MNFLSTIGNLLVPDLQNVEAQANQATEQLQLAFQVIIAEGAIIAVLMIAQIYLMKKAA